MQKIEGISPPQPSGILPIVGKVYFFLPKVSVRANALRTGMSYQRRQT